MLTAGKTTKFFKKPPSIDAIFSPTPVKILPSALDTMTHPINLAAPALSSLMALSATITRHHMMLFSVDGISLILISLAVVSCPSSAATKHVTPLHNTLVQKRFTCNNGLFFATRASQIPIHGLNFIATLTMSSPLSDHEITRLSSRVTSTKALATM